MTELKLDGLREVFKLDKEVISFNLNSDISENEPSKSSINLENDIKVSNLTEEYLAFRVKATKKLYYSVKPTYCIIPPKEEKTIIIKFILKKGEIPKLQGHKFKFEGFIIQENEKEKEAKNLFNEYTQKGEQVVGNLQKTFVQFLNNDEIESQNSSENKKNLLDLPRPQLTHLQSSSNLSEYADIDEIYEFQDENKGLLKDQVEFNEDKKPTLNDIISEEKSKNIEKEKNEEKKEETNNILEKKFEVVNEEILNKNEIISKNENNISTIFNKFGNDASPVSDALTFIALFIAMLLGYYLVK